jgi:capsule biosynthesis phosphatase
MIILIPLGGTGQRFKNNGYQRPKALVNVFGTPIISHLLNSLATSTVEYVYIPYNKEYKKYRFESLLQRAHPNIDFRFLCLEDNTRGAAETVNIALNHLECHKDCPVLCLDGDNFYNYDIVTAWNGNNCIFTCEDSGDSPIYSYVRTDSSGNVVDIKEKERISNRACTGAYGFASLFQLKAYTSRIISANIQQKSEFYTSGAIKAMVTDGLKFRTIPVDQSDYVCLGTPLQLKLFYNNCPRTNSLDDGIAIKNKRICFDLDNTLVTFPRVTGDYTSVQPIHNNIALLRYLKKMGNTIIIYTARRMKTHGGNVGKINADIGKITFDTLDEFSIPYDEIYFGKPHADFYIDDLAVNCFGDLEKELGFYNNKIEPRDFHTLQASSMSTIIKKGDLSGECHYYSNIPCSLKDMFPLFLAGDDNSITIERVHGLTVTELYLSEMLTESTLVHVLNSVNRIHSCSDLPSTTANIYANYAAKLKSRYQNYDYSSFEDSEVAFKRLLSDLEHYEKSGAGKVRVVHGDPVFTNIMINVHGKIKFIDMRGKLGDQLTICGDWLYDWAKVYQSLVGYDEILLSRTISPVYKQSMIDVFTNYFISKFSREDFENLKTITRSLLFTLIPLHDNDKCTEFYQLMESKHLK